MLFKRIESEGLAHYSYIIGDGGEAAVIDPRRDCSIYEWETSRKGHKIKYILETHRNEDYITGSTELKSRTEAEIWHADSQWDYGYGQPVEDGQLWKIGRLKIRAIHSPGHTPGMMSYLLHDPEGYPWIIFTGDSLFAGDVGRVDLLGMDKAEEMADKLYDTIFERILPLGDGLIVCPAHGSGSVCGSEIAERTWTTVGLEKKYNPILQHSNKQNFISLVAKEQERPPYFKKMEEINLRGANILGALQVPSPLSPEEFESKMNNSFILDTRMEVGFGSAHIPGAQSIWMEGLPNFAGWFLSYEKPILLVNENDDPLKAVRYLIRIGYDNIAGYLSGGMLSWHKSGKESSSIETVTVQTLCKYLDKEKTSFILDVRSDKEIDSKGKIEKAFHMHVTQIPNNLEKIPKKEKTFIFCGSGLRSMIAASYLRKNGWKNLTVVLGGLAGWNSTTCPVEI